MPRNVLDASAVLAWLFEEDGADIVDAALDGSALLTVNLAEVLYRCDDQGMGTERVAADLRDLGVAIEAMTTDDAEAVPIVRRLARESGVRCSLADYACMALAVRLHVPVLSAERSWLQVPLPVPVHAVR